MRSDIVINRALFRCTYLRGAAALGAASIATLLAGHASAQTITLQSALNDRFLEAVPGSPAAAIGGSGGALARFRRLYLGNGWFVLQNRASGRCLTVNTALGGLLTESAARDGDPNEQFQLASGTSASTVALLARANGRYVSVDPNLFDLASASATTVGAASSFDLAEPDPNQTPTGTPDLDAPRQTIVGFGGALVFGESRLTSNPYQAEVFHALFDPKDGLGITYLRIGNNYGISETDSSGYADENPDLVQQASAALGRPVGIIMSGWGPPAYLKSNGSVNGGTLRTVNGGYDYAGYAAWWKSSIQYWRGQGIDPTFVSIQNEPEVIVSYISNHFAPFENVPYTGVAAGNPYGVTEAAGYGRALDAVYRQFRTLSSPPLLIGPEPDGPGSDKVQAFMAGVNENEIVAIAHHLYDTADADQPDSFDPALQSVADDFPNKPKFMTEWFSDDAPIVEAEAIHDVLVTESGNAYIKWSLANGATVASAIYDDNGAEPSTWLYPHGWHINDNYWVMKHYAYFVRPGFVRLDTYVDDPDLRLSAFVDPKSADPAHPRGAAVLLNTSATRTITFRLRLPAGSVRSSTIHRTSFNGTERWNDLGTIAANPEVTLPPDSIVTWSVNAD